MREYTNDCLSESDAERALLQRVVNKDREAFAALYQNYRPRLIRFLSRQLRSAEMIEEVLNDVMFTVWQSAANFKGQSKVSTWIFGIAYLKGLKCLQKIKPLPDADLYISSLEMPDSPEAEHSREMLRRDMLALVNALPVEQRVIVELTYYNGFSCEEVSCIMDIPTNTVKTRMYHARQKLKKHLSRLESA